MYKKLSILILCVLFFTGCDRAEKDSFWYPIENLQAICSGRISAFRVDVLKMTNSTGWRSWPYYIDIETKKEVSFEYASCVFVSIKKFDEGFKNRNDLSDFQKEYLIEGF